MYVVEKESARLSAYLLNHYVQGTAQRLLSEVISLHLSSSSQMGARCTLNYHGTCYEKKAKIETAKR
jgi:hypothetical protein